MSGISVCALARKMLNFPLRTIVPRPTYYWSSRPILFVDFYCLKIVTFLFRPYAYYTSRYTSDLRSRNFRKAVRQRSSGAIKEPPQNNAYFSVYYYTKCALLKAGCVTLQRKVCTIKFLRQVSKCK